MMVAGVLHFNWSLLRILTFFWLHTLVMVFFVGAFLKKWNKLPFDPNMIIGGGGILIAMVAYYMGIVLLSEDVVQTFNRGDWMSAFRPLYQTIAVLASVSIGHLYEFRFFSKLGNVQPVMGFNYVKIFVARFFILQAVIFSGIFMGNKLTPETKIIPITVLIVLKQLVELWIFSMYSKKLVPEENEFPEI